MAWSVFLSFKFSFDNSKSSLAVLEQPAISNNPNNDMTLEQINERISKEYCEATEICLKDENMIEFDC